MNEPERRRLRVYPDQQRTVGRRQRIELYWRLLQAVASVLSCQEPSCQKRRRVSPGGLVANQWLSGVKKAKISPVGGCHAASLPDEMSQILSVRAFNVTAHRPSGLNTQPANPGSLRTTFRVGDGVAKVSGVLDIQEDGPAIGVIDDGKPPPRRSQRIPAYAQLPGTLRARVGRSATTAGGEQRSGLARPPRVLARRCRAIGQRRNPPGTVGKQAVAVRVKENASTGPAGRCPTSGRSPRPRAGRRQGCTKPVSGRPG